MKNKGFRARLNHEIRVPQVRLISAEGEQLGVVNIEEAIKKAQESGLDLIEIAAQVNPPVCKILDFSKYKYEKAKKLKEAKKKQRFCQTKEVRIRPRIGTHDLEVKIKHIKEFIARKDRVKISIIFYGRENIHRNLGIQLIDRIKDSVAETAVIEQELKKEGNRMTCLLAPKK